MSATRSTSTAQPMGGCYSYSEKSSGFCSTNWPTTSHRRRRPNQAPLGRLRFVRIEQDAPRRPAANPRHPSCADAWPDREPTAASWPPPARRSRQRTDSIRLASDRAPRPTTRGGNEYSPVDQTGRGHGATPTSATDAGDDEVQQGGNATPVVVGEHVRSDELGRIICPATRRDSPGFHDGATVAPVALPAEVGPPARRGRARRLRSDRPRRSVRRTEPASCWRP